MSFFTTGIAFIKEILKSPRRMGTICPSSYALARNMADKIDKDSDGLIIELGAGTGCITEALIQRGIDPSRLIIIDYSKIFVDILRDKYPALKIIQGDACELSSFIGNIKNVKYVISSLPFASFKKEEQSRIISEIDKIMPDGKIIQYTYVFMKEHTIKKFGYKCISSSITWKNMPPAKVMEFSR